MANQERKFGEGTMETIRNIGAIGVVLGIIAAIASVRFAGELFIAGAATAGTGEVGRRAVRGRDRNNK